MKMKGREIKEFLEMEVPFFLTKTPLGSVRYMDKYRIEIKPLFGDVSVNIAIYYNDKSGKERVSEIGLALCALKELHKDVYRKQLLEPACYSLAKKVLKEMDGSFIQHGLKIGPNAPRFT